VILEPDFALGHSALAEAWSALGYDTRAVASAQRALSLSSSLPEDERLEIEGRYYELSHDWAGAIGAYRHLWQDFPDDLESGLRLAAAQTSAGNVDEASATLSSLRSLPEAQRDDPRIDLAEASVAQRNGDYKRQQVLSEDATRKAQSSGARLLLAQGHLVRAVALKAQSQLQEATHSCLAALEIFQAASDREGAAVALSDLGLILQQQGDLNGARQRLELASDYFRQVGDTKGFNSALSSLREISRAQGQTVDEKLSTLSQ
jgi:tetratricopeptide (TPR) repeat protein